MNTFVELRKIRFYAYHGVAEQERCVGNDYEIYVKVKYPFKDAMETDNWTLRSTMRSCMKLFVGK